LPPADLLIVHLLLNRQHRLLIVDWQPAPFFKSCCPNTKNTKNGQNMKTGQLFRLAAAGLLLFFLSCTKQGPAGATGATGTQGPPGAQGSTGSQGPEGNANVTTVIFQNVTLTENGNTMFNIPAITQAILDSGVVVAYYQGLGGDTWFSLPVYYLSGGTLTSITLYDLQLGSATLKDVGISTGPVNYRFDVIATN
jgi:hypothetical protein